MYNSATLFAVLTPILVATATPVAGYGVVAAGATSADDKVAAPLVEAIARCLEIKADAARLACSDAAGRALVEATRKREIVVVDREEVKKTRRSLFGFQLPRIGLFGRDGPDDGVEEVKRIDTVLKSVVAMPYGRYLLTTEDGAKWSTTEAWSGSIAPRAGMKITIQKGALGGYDLQVPGGRYVRGIRTG